VLILEDRALLVHKKPSMTEVILGSHII